MQGDTAVLKKEGEWRNNKVAMPARCRWRIFGVVHAGAAMPARWRNAPSRCGYRRMSIQSKPPHQASLIRWLRQQSRPRGGRHASSMARCALSLRLSPYVPKNRTPPVSKLTSGCRPREVRHASSMARCALSLRLSPYVDSAKAASSSELDSVAPAESTHGS